MEVIKAADSEPVIPIVYFGICHEDGKTRKEISQMYTKSDVTKNKSCYYLQKFEHHLKVLGITLKDYIKKHLNEWPVCPRNGEEVGISGLDGRGVILSTYVGPATKENCPQFKAFCDKISISRLGEGNPMFEKEPWNLGLTSETNEVIKRMAGNAVGRKASDQTKEKLRQIMLNSPLKARHTTPHSPETIEKLRENTAKLWASGAFNRVTSIHLAMREFLANYEFNFELEEEFQVKYYAVDFAFPEVKVAVECQGTFFHIDPRKYPNGPQTAIQRRNFGRDKAKRTYLTTRGWTIIEVWEKEINNGEFKGELICKLKELKVLKASE